MTVFHDKWTTLCFTYVINSFKPHFVKAHLASNGNCHTFLGVVISRYRCIKRVSGKRFANNLRLLSFWIWQMCSHVDYWPFYDIFSVFVFPESSHLSRPDQILQPTEPLLTFLNGESLSPLSLLHSFTCTTLRVSLPAASSYNYLWTDLTFI